MVDEHDTGFSDNPEWEPTNTRPVTDASQRLRVARATLGLTQAAMAEMLGVSVATVRNWEQGRVEPDDAARTLIRLLAFHPRQMHELLRTPERA